MRTNKKNISAGGTQYKEAIHYLKQLLNTTFGIGGILSILNFNFDGK